MTVERPRNELPNLMNRNIDLRFACSSALIFGAVDCEGGGGAAATNGVGAGGAGGARGAGGVGGDRGACF